MSNAININASDLDPFNGDANADTSLTNSTSPLSLTSNPDKIDTVMKGRLKKHADKVKSKLTEAQDELAPDIGNADPMHHQKLLEQIQRYFASRFFGQYLKDMNYEHKGEKLKKMSVAQLQDQLNRMKYSVCIRNSGGVLQKGVNEGLSVARLSIQASTYLYLLVT